MIAELALFALAFAAGFPLALIIDRRASGGRLAGEALLIGIAVTAVLSLLWSRAFFVAALIVVMGVAFFGAIRAQRSPEELSPQSSVLSPLFKVATFILLLGYALFATLAPPWEFDFLVGWGLKARQFWEAKGIDWSFLESATYRGIHPDYPPLLPLAYDAVAVLRGAWSDRYLGLYNVAFAVALLLIVYRLAVEELESDDAAAFIVLAMVPFAASPWIGIAEGPFVAYGTAALLLIRRDAMSAGAVMLGLAACVKNEGLALIAAVAIGLIVAGRWRALARLWPAVVLPLPWIVVRSMHHLPTDIAQGSVLTRIIDHLREPSVFLAVAHYPLGKRLFWAAMLIAVVIVFRELVRERFVLTALFAQFLFYIGAYLASPHDVGWHVRWSWERLISHLTPALTFVILVTLLRQALATTRSSGFFRISRNKRPMPMQIAESATLNAGQ